MAADRLQNGTSVIIQTSVDSGTTWLTIAATTSAKLSSSMSPREASTKDSGRFKKILSGEASWSMSAEGFAAFDTVSLYSTTKALADLHLAGTEIMLRWSWVTTGDEKYTGSAYITKIDFDAQRETTVGQSIAFDGTGALTAATL